VGISPDSQRVVYLADQQTDGVYELFSVPILGGAVTRLNDLLVAGGDVTSFKISDDSEWVVYVADQEIDGLPTGHRAPIAGPAGSAERIWYRAHAFDPWDYAIDTPRGRVIVNGNQTLVDGIVRLWSFPLAGSPDPGGGEELVPASAFDPDGDVVEFVLYPDALRVQYCRASRRVGLGRLASAPNPSVERPAGAAAHLMSRWAGDDAHLGGHDVETCE
jgi:hypothetical protein